MSRARRRRSLIATLALLALAPAPAAAQPPPSGEGASTEATFQRGLAAYDAGDYAGAIAIWERLLLSLDPSRAWRLFFNLGLAAQAMGDATSAVERFEGFLHKLAEQPARLPPDLEAKRLEAADRVKKLKAQSGAVHVLPHPSRDVLVKIDLGTPRAPGFTAYLAPGEHVVEVRPGTPDVRKINVRTTAGGSVDVDPTDPPPTDPKPNAVPPRALAPTPPPPEPERRSFPTGWLAAGLALTAASTALPIALTLSAKGKRDDAIALGPGSTRYASAVDDFHRARTTAEVTWIVPAVLAVATGVVVLLAMPRTEPARTASR
jgi:tetratricopeptide (TPR) repeat protein